MADTFLDYQNKPVSIMAQQFYQYQQQMAQANQYSVSQTLMAIPGLNLEQLRVIYDMVKAEYKDRLIKQLASIEDEDE